MTTEGLVGILLLAIPILIAITFHEAAHGFVANFFGDDTAKRQGRVTLNPIKHIDPFGTLILPGLLLFFTGFMFGFAKPVPVDQTKLRNPRFHMIWVAIAGVVMNVILAFVSAFLLTGLLRTNAVTTDLIPNILLASISVNFILAVFNILPIPPLDGSKVLASLLPAGLARAYLRLEPLGFVFLLLALVVLPLLGNQLNMNLDLFAWVVLIPADTLTAWLQHLVGIG